MKTIIRLPLEQFAFIEQEFDKEMTPAEAIEAYNELQRAYKGGDGLTAKEIDAMLDSYFLGKGVDSNQYAKLNAEQVKWIQAFKRCINRCKGKVGLEEEIN